MHGLALLALYHGKGHALGGVGNIDGHQARRVLQAHRPHLQRAARGQRLRQRPALGIVHIHHGHAQAGPIEQLGLGLPVSVHAAVVVQVVLGEVGKDGSINSSPRKAMLNYSNR